jgi:hypothetical protein
VAYVGIAVALVGLVQSVAWLGSESVGGRRRRQAMVLAPVSVLVLMLSLVHLLVPGFWVTGS